MYGNVARNTINPSAPQGYDPRLQSTPRSIPQNQGLNPIPRGPGSATRNFPPYSPAQSPQQHGGYMQSVYNVNPNDANPSSIINQSPSTKPNSNGQHMWQMTQMQQFGQGQHQQQQNVYHRNPSMPSKFPRPLQSSAPPYQQGFSPSTAGMTPSGNPSYFYSPSAAPVRPPQRFSTASNPAMLTPSAQTPMHQTSNYFQQASSPFYPNPNQAPQISGYPPNMQSSQFDPSMYPSSGQNFVHPSQMMSPQSMQQMQMQIPQPHQVAPPSIPQSSSQRKGITIKDPNTMQDVTSKILKSGRQSESDPGGSRPPSVPSFQSQQQQQQPPQQVAAQFAAKVAAVAGAPHDRAASNVPPMPMTTAGQGDVSRFPPHITHPIKAVSPVGLSVIPSGVDTSKPPPPLKSIHNQVSLPPTSAPIPAQTHPMGSMQTPPPSFAKASNLLSTSPGHASMLSGNVLQMHVNIAAVRPEAPVAVVQPVPSANQTADVESKVTGSIPVEGTLEIDQKELLTIPSLIQHDNVISELANDQVIKKEIATRPEIDITASQANDVLTSNDAGAFDIKSADVSSTVDSKSQSDEPSAQTSEVSAKPAHEIKSLPPGTDANVLEEQGDVKNLEASLTNLEVDTKTEKTLSKGDSTQKEMDERPLRSTPEVEVFMDSERNDVASKNTEAEHEANHVNESDVNDESSSTAPLPDAILDNQNYDSGSINTSGKKIYARDFLLHFRFHSTSMEKPVDLPHIEDIIRDVPLPKSSVSSTLPSVGFSYRDSSPDFTPPWMRSSGPKGGRQASRGSRPNQQRPGFGMGYHSQSGSPKVITINKSLHKEPELNKAENAWKPSKFEPKAATGVLTDEEQTEEVLRNVRSILNKLTPQKFTALLEKFKQLPIDTETRLREVTNLIFEKAIDEPSFSEAYANMCRVMSQFKVSTQNTTAAQVAASNPQSSTVEFRKVLLTRCQREFEKDRTNEDLLGDLRKKMEEAKTAEKQQLKEELEYKEAKERRRMLGNIRFIGELFKLQMLTESIMHNCLMSLFRKRDDESLESLCRLLMTIGKDLDHPKGKLRMDQYFGQIEKIIVENKTSSRVRFMLKDVVDLRLNKWTPRAIQAQGPKTIDQIHQDAKEEKEKQLLQQAAAPPMKPQSRGGRMGSRGGGGHNASDEGWTKVVQHKPMRIDPMKMKLSKFDESMTLGPNRGKVGWKSGSGSGTRTGSGGYSGKETLEGIPSRSSTPTLNRFSALGSGSSGRMSSQERTKSDSRGSTGSGRGSGREERLSTLDTVRKMTSAERKSLGNNRMRDRQKTPSPSPRIKVDVEAIKKKLNAIITEYFFLKDIKEATECFDELTLPPPHQYLIVQTCIETSLEKTAGNRISVSQLLSSLVRNDKVTPDQYVAGVANNMELAAELELDLPRVWSCLSELLASIFYDSNGKIPLVLIKKMSSPLKEVGKTDVFVVEILKSLIAEKGLNEVLQHWRGSRLSINDFIQEVDPMKVQEFLERHNLQDFNDLTPPSKFDFFLSNFTELLKSNKNNEPILDWANKQYPHDKKQDLVLFVRALITAVCKSAIIKRDAEDFVFNKEVFSTRLSLLKPFINDEDLELEAVYALQRLFVQLEQPANLLKIIFDFVNVENLIADTTFLKWESDTNPKELEGKGVALNSVKSFLTWLRLEDNETDDEAEKKDLQAAV